MSAKQGRNGRKFGKAGRAITAELQARGIRDYEFSKGKHARVSFNFNGRDHEVVFACTPRDEEVAARQALKRLRRVLDGGTDGIA